VDVALRRFIDLDLKAVFEVVKRTVEFCDSHRTRSKQSLYVNVGPVEMTLRSCVPSFGSIISCGA
jgi:hypothetical protein